ncbi:MAG: amino acid adenylation domain-containing protein [Stackebrandtia sp.]
MRILHVLVGPELGSAGKGIAEYLVDAGHFVYMLDSRPLGSEEWRRSLGHNSCVVEEDALPERRVDYEIGAGVSSRSSAPVLAVELRAAEARAEVDCFLRTSQHEALVCGNAPAEESADALRAAVSATCVDALIRLSREGDASLKPRSRPERCDDLPELLRMEAAAAALEARATSIELREDRFDVAELPGVDDGGSEEVLRYELDAYSVHFKERFLEWLCVYVQMLLNARKSGVYGYDLHTSQGKMRKHVEASGNLRASDLDARIDLPEYRLWENAFYVFSDVFENSRSPRIAAQYDVVADSEDAILTLRYRGDDNSLEVAARGRIPFLAVLREHLDSFFAKLPRFAAGAADVDELLALPDTLRDLDAELNRTRTPYPDDQPIHRLIEEQAARRGDEIAVVCGDVALTYREFNEAANRFARQMRSRCGARPGDLIALYLDRSENLLIAATAALKLGCAYVPLDLNSPADRTAGILADSAPKLVVGDASTSAQIGDITSGTAILAVDAEKVREESAQLPGENLDVNAAADDLAYVIYTSGTTGKPKGVAVEHRSFVNIAADVGACVDFKPGERMLAVTTIAFDISTLEIFMPLMRGGTVVLAGRADLLDARRLLGLIEQGVGVVQATPSLWQLIVQSLDGGRLPVRALCGGEALPAPLAARLARSVEECWNVYGPTETTVWSTRFRVTPDDPRPLIGMPVANTRCCVRDENMRPLPTGVTGELYIGGAGVARGYLNRPELTAERFVDDPFGDGRLYRTGDLVRRLPDGNLEFLGRNDFQIKLRGHRIELGEIESALNAHPSVRQSLVVVGRLESSQSDESRFLAGYYVAETPVDDDELREHLASLVPDYMLPAVLVGLDGMPLNVNGKVDRGALPDPARLLSRDYVAPTTALQTRLCEIWGQVLGASAQEERRVGVADDFFACGGNSILGIRLVNKINSELGSNIRIRDVFREKTVQNLEPLVAGSLGDFAFRDFVVDGVDDERLHEPFPLTNVQQTYYLGRHDGFELSSVSTHVYSEFLYDDVDRERLETAFNLLVRRHLALRTVFADGQQRFLPEVPRYRVALRELNDHSELEELRGEYSHKLYDPERYPLFDVVLSRLDGVFRLHISFDALIVDMGSFDILFDEWARLYEDPNLTLPELGVSYRDYVLQYEKVRDSPMLTQAQRYWEGKADDYDLELKLPLKTRPSSVDKPRFARKSKVVPAAVWNALSDKCRRYGVSPTALVLELFGRVLGRWSGQDQLCVNLTLFNRLPLHPDVDGVVGDFTVLELFDYRLERDLGVADKLRRVHGELLEDIDNNLFDGVDFQRLLKARHGLPADKIAAPVVLTSTLGAKTNASMFELALNDSYRGVEYSISQTPQVWLDNKAYETDEGFVAEWDYVEQLFDPTVVDAMHDDYCRLIAQAAELDWDGARFPAPRVPAADLAIVEAANAHTRPRSEHTLFGLYESRLDADGRGDAVAVVDAAADASYTYDRLRRDSARLAAALLDAEIVPDKPETTAILAEKGYLQAVAALGVMKAGSAYVPLNVDWPGARVAEVLESAETGVLLASRAQLEREDVRALESTCRLLAVEDLIDGGRERELPTVDPDDVAYVIFTSGSTGKPKGVTISHRGAVNTILAVNERFGVRETDRVLALSELSFDLSVYDLFGTLAAGGTIVFPAQEETKNPAHWARLVERHGVSVWNSVPQLAGLLVDEADAGAPSLESLRVWMLSGDWIPTSLPDRIRALTPAATVMGLGGATEGSIWSIWHEIDRVDPVWSSIPYGQAMPNQRMYVLDAAGEHCPAGVAGEICIGGDGVARGYWRDPQLTAERYIEHPTLGRLYKTGDLGRWSRDGWIEFLGRDDHQVKLNGYRVELEEIAVKLTRLHGVDRAVAAVQKGDEHDRLVGYLVPSADYTPINEPADLSLDKQAFLMDRRGVLADATPEHDLDVAVDPAEYLRDKSYRRFLDDGVDPSLTRKRYFEASRPAAPAAFAPSRIDRRDLAAVLAPLSATHLPERALPKYRYPSAGAAYPVRTFVSLTGAASDLNAGHFYYHPSTRQLCSHGLEAVAAQDGDRRDEIQLVAYLPAAEPLYGERARRFALLEAGHMLALLTAALEARGVAYQADVDARRLDDDHVALCRVVLGDGDGFRPSELELSCFLRDADAAEYREHGGARRFSPGDLPVFDRVDDVYAILRRARCLLALEGDGDARDTLSAGFVFQRLSERLRADGLGTCPLGLNVTAEGVYTLAVGAVDQRSRETSDSPADPPTLTQAVTEELALALPDYMLPSGYIVLDALPLSANGKLAVDRLPRAEFAGAHVAPATETELALAGVWADVLGRPVETIGAADSFFAVGGNSLAAMRLVRVLQRDLGVDLRLRDLYRNDTIAKLAARVGAVESDAAREEGEL